MSEFERAAEKDNLESLSLNEVFCCNECNLCSDFECSFSDSELFCEQDGFTLGVVIEDALESEDVGKDTFK